MLPAYPAAPGATAARSTCSPRWTTRPARSWPNARSTAPPAKSRLPATAGRLGPGRGRWSPPTRHRPRGRCRVPGGRQASALPVHRQGQSAGAAGPLRRPALASRACAGPHPRPRPRPRRAPHPQGRHRQRVRVPARRTGHPGHAQDPGSANPAVADHDRVRDHQPSSRPARPGSRTSSEGTGRSRTACTTCAT